MDKATGQSIFAEQSAKLQMQARSTSHMSEDLANHCSNNSLNHADNTQTEQPQAKADNLEQLQDDQETDYRSTLQLEQQLQAIPAFQFIHSHLCTSAQPSASDFANIKAYGFNSVINLALSDAEAHLPNQDRICLGLELNYMHLPLSWDTPNAEQAILVLDLIDCLVQSQMVWLHCAKNFRVSCLMALYKQFYLQQPLDQIECDLQRIWQPNETWTGLMHSVRLQLQGRQSTAEINQLC